MNDVHGFAAATFIRIVVIWGIVRYWANSRYHADEDPVDSLADETEPAERSAKRARAGKRTRRFLLTWMAGAVIVWLSGLSMLMVSDAGQQVTYWISFGFAVAFVSFVFFVAEWAATAGFRTFLNIIGWACAVVVSLVYCGTATHPGELLVRLVERTLIEPRPLTLLIAYFVAVFPAGSVIGRFMHRWTEELPSDQGLTKAGQWIGRLERFLIVSFLVAGQPTAIAILVTAKGVLRFGEIRNDADPNHQRRLVEYILIGSMMSYAVALSVGWITMHLL